jgi:hypothetical protein
MLPFEKLDAAHELCHVLMWDNPTLAKQFFAAFKATVDDDVSECFALSEPLRTALRSVLVYREWDELDLMLDDLQEQVRRRRLAIRFNEVIPMTKKRMKMKTNLSLTLKIPMSFSLKSMMC